MSLSAWEQQALDSIKDGLAGSDPTLVARLTIFTRLASDEEMPTRRRSRPARGKLSGVLATSRHIPAGRTSAWACCRQCRCCCGW